LLDDKEGRGCASAVQVLARMGSDGYEAVPAIIRARGSSSIFADGIDRGILSRVQLACGRKAGPSLWQSPAEG
jgi:hypothetical protein